MELLNNTLQSIGLSTRDFIDIIITSAVALILSLGIALIVLVNMRKDYFLRTNPVRLSNSNSYLRYAKIIAKNLIGAALVISGMIMIFLPGQGVITILIGIMMLDFPGKRRVEKKIISQPKVLRTINMVRKRFGKESLTTDSKVK